MQQQDLAPKTALPPSADLQDIDIAAVGAEKALKAMVEYQVESLRFATKRSCANLEFLRRLPHCKGFEDLTELQRSWFKDCVLDYGEEVGRLAGTGLQLVTGELVPLQWLLYRRPASSGRGRRRSG